MKHSAGEYARCDVNTNTAEGYFGVFKKGMRGVYQHCAEKHLHRYLAEFDFRFNNRTALNVSDGERAALAVKSAAGKRLSTGGLTSPDFSHAAKRFKRWRHKNVRFPKPPKKKVKRIWVR